MQPFEMSKISSKAETLFQRSLHSAELSSKRFSASYQSSESPSQIRQTIPCNRPTRERKTNSLFSSFKFDLNPKSLAQQKIHPSSSCRNGQTIEETPLEEKMELEEIKEAPAVPPPRKYGKTKSTRSPPNVKIKIIPLMKSLSYPRTYDDVPTKKTNQKPERSLSVSSTCSRKISTIERPKSPPPPPPVSTINESVQKVKRKVKNLRPWRTTSRKSTHRSDLLENKSKTIQIVPIGRSSLPRHQLPVITRLRQRASKSGRWRSARDTASTVRWEIASSFAALVECGRRASGFVGAVGDRAISAVVSGWSTATTMTDNKIQDLKRSISSWSLSTFKKPKVSTIKFKKPKLNLFSKKKSRLSPEDKENSSKETTENLVTPEVNDENDSSNCDNYDDSDRNTQVSGHSPQIIHEPDRNVSKHPHPTIVLTVHDSTTDSTTEDNGTKESTNPFENDDDDKESTSLLGTNEEIEFIDSDCEDNTPKSATIKFRYNKGDYKKDWYDDTGKPCKTRDEMTVIGLSDNDYEFYSNSKFYEALGIVKPNDGTSYEDITDAVISEGSSKAREWVQSMNEDAIRCAEELKAKKEAKSNSLTKFSSETNLNKPDGQWANKDEIILKATEKLPDKKGPKNYLNYLRKEFNSKVNFSKDRKKKPKITEKEKEEQTSLVHKESMKKVFEVRGKLAHQNIVDTELKDFKETDIYIATTPIPLATAERKKLLNKTDSIDTNEEGIHGTSLDLDSSIDMNQSLEMTNNIADDLIAEKLKEIDVDKQSIKSKEMNNEIISVEINQTEEETQIDLKNSSTLNNTLAEAEKPLKSEEPKEIESKNTAMSQNTTAQISFDEEDDIVPPLPVKKKRISGHFSEEPADINKSGSMINPYTNSELSLTDEKSFSEPLTSQSFASLISQDTMGEGKLDISLTDNTFITDPGFSKSDVTASLNSVISINDDFISASNTICDPSKHPKIEVVDNKDMKHDDKELKVDAGAVIDKEVNKTINDVNIHVSSDISDENILKETHVKQYIEEQPNIPSEESQKKKSKKGFFNRDNIFRRSFSKEKTPDKERFLSRLSRNSSSSRETTPVSDIPTVYEVTQSTLTCSSTPSPCPLNRLDNEESDSLSDIYRCIHARDDNSAKKDKSDNKPTIVQDEYDTASTIYPSFVTALEDLSGEFSDDRLQFDEKACDIALNEAFNYNLKSKQGGSIDKQTTREQFFNEYEQRLKKRNEMNDANIILKNRDSSASFASYDSHTQSHSATNIIKDIIPNTVIEEPPKPSPRTKKGRYGYSGTNNNFAPPNTNYQGDLVKESNKQRTIEQILTPPERKIPPIPSPRTHIPGKPVQPFSPVTQTPKNPFEEEIDEPLYWEISDTSDFPKPSPRNKKGKKSPNIQTSDKNISKSNGTNNSSGDSDQNLPNWIQRRGPIPSPRSKGKLPMQSMPNVAQTEEERNGGNCRRKLEFTSNAETLKESTTILPTAWVGGEEFYSGKAASIAYGVSSHREGPSSPTRIKKPSQTSLPDSCGELFISPQRPPLNQSTQNGHAEIRQLKRLADTIYSKTEKENRLSIIQLWEEKLKLLTGIVLNIGQEQPVAQNDELLGDVIFSVQSIIGKEKDDREWLVSQGSNSQIAVNLKQIKSYLRAAFNVSEEKLEEVTLSVNERQEAQVSLFLTVIEAKELKGQTIKGGSNAYVTLNLPGSGESHSTLVEKETLNPTWNQPFTLKVKNIQKEVLKITVWHKFESLKLNKLKDLTDLHSATRLIKNTKAVCHHQESHVLGTVDIALKDIGEHDIDDWFTLNKEPSESTLQRRGAKSSTTNRGAIHISARVGTNRQTSQDSRKSYDALLSRLIHHEIATTSNNNIEEEYNVPWAGKLPAAGSAVLAQHAIMQGLKEHVQQLSWWLVGSRVPNVSYVWLLAVLHKVQSALGQNQYSSDHVAALQMSFAIWTKNAFEKLKNLHESFSVSSEVIAQHQLTNFLKILKSLETHTESQKLLENEGLSKFVPQIQESLRTHALVWWTELLDNNLNLKQVRKADEQLLKFITITQETFCFINDAKNFYNPVFMKEYEIEYLKDVFLLLTQRIKPCVRPLLMNIYMQMPPISESDVKDDNLESYALSSNSNLWQLYMNLSRLHRIGETLSQRVQNESGIFEYHRWFSKGVMRWIELASYRAQSMIRKAVELDHFVPIDKYNNFSSSATDTTGVFVDIKIWWRNLNWPDVENSGVLLVKILEDVCSCCTMYSDLLQSKVDSMFIHQQNTNQFFISEQVCVGMNNIERVRTELLKLPIYFHVEDLIKSIKEKGVNGDAGADQIKLTVETLISNASDNMESKVIDFTNTVIKKLSSSLENALIESCDYNSPDPLIIKVLVPSLETLKDNLDENNFQRFLIRMWEEILVIFNHVINKNADRRRSSYFSILYEILETTLTVFTPSDGAGLDVEEAKNSEYKELIETLESLRISAECLISKYYEERLEEQSHLRLKPKAQLFFKSAFTKGGKLIVTVIMAKDIVVDADAGSLSSRGANLFGGSHQPVDSYVKVQLVPTEWFPNQPIKRTKTQRKSDPAVYDETFEFELTSSNDSVSSGFILFTLKDHNLGRTNTFIGEAIVAMKDVPLVESSMVHTVKNSDLSMSTPSFDIGYKSLKALRLRTYDKVGQAFLKKISKRIPAAK